MDRRAQKIHLKRLKREARQRVLRHEKFVQTHGTSESRRAKNLAKYPSLAEPDKRPSIRGKDWTPKPAQTKTEVTKEVAAEQGIPVVNQEMSPGQPPI